MSILQIDDLLFLIATLHQQTVEQIQQVKERKAMSEGSNLIVLNL